MDAIVEAAAQILVQDGAAAVTTQSVAERAGVSVGTLYQYFADRDAVLAALRTRVMTEQLEAVAAVMAQIDTTQTSFEEALERLMDAVFALVSVRPELIRRLILEAPPDAPVLVELPWKEQANQLVRGVLYGAPDRVRAGNVDVMATLIVSSVFGMVRDVAVRRPDLLRSPDLRAEVTRMIRRYLEP